MHFGAIMTIAIALLNGSNAQAGDFFQYFSDKINARPHTLIKSSLKDDEAQTETNQNWRITTNIDYSDVIIDFDENITSKAIDQLRFRQNGVIQNNTVYISGILKGLYLGEWTSQDSAFPILTRFPNHSGTNAHRFFSIMQLWV